MHGLVTRCFWLTVTGLTYCLFTMANEDACHRFTLPGYSGVVWLRESCMGKLGAACGLSPPARDSLFSVAQWRLAVCLLLLSLEASCGLGMVGCMAGLHWLRVWHECGLEIAGYKLGPAGLARTRFISLA